MKRVKGYFVIIIKQFDDTMFGADYHYTPWCIAHKKYCRFHKTEKIKKFCSFSEATQYIKEDIDTNSHDRELEIAYLTTVKAEDNENDHSQLINWIHISCENDALNYDLKQASYNGDTNQTQQPSAEAWDSNSFSAIFSQHLKSN